MYRRPQNIRVTAVLSQKSKLFTSMEKVAESTGVSVYMLRKIKRGSTSNIIRGKDDLLFLIEFLFDEVVSLTPAWDTANDGTTIKTFSSHYSAMMFLGCSKSTYYRRSRMQPLGEPCKVLVKDSFGREWVITFLKNGEFNKNKKGE